MVSRSGTWRCYISTTFGYLLDLVQNYMKAFTHTLLTYFKLLLLSDSSVNEKGYDFSIASQYPQNIFQNVSPPAAFTGPTDVPMNIDFQHAVPQLPPTSLNGGDKDKINELIKSAPITQPLKETDSAPVTCASTPMVSSPSSTSVSMTSSQKSTTGGGRAGSRRGSETTVAEPPPKPVQRKSSTPLGALQKWLQIGTESRQNSSTSSSSGMKQQASNVMEVSKSLVKERIGVFGGGDKGKQQPTVVPPPPLPPTVASSATQTSPEEQMSPFGTTGHFNIGSTPNAAPPSGFQPAGGDKGVKPSPKPERKKRGTTRSRTSYRDRERLRSPPRAFESNTSFGSTPMVDVSHKVAIGPGQAHSLRAVFGAILSHSEIIHDAMASASYLRFITKETDGGRSDAEGVEVSSSEVDEGVTVVGKGDEENEESAGGGGGSDRQQDANLDNKSLEVTTAVVMRKKHGSPAKSKCWRHSLEVTTPSRYLRDNPNIKLAPLDSSPVVSEPNIINNQNPTITPEKPVIPEPVENKGLSDSNEQLPFAMIALGEIWKYVKSSCVDFIVHERVTSTPLEHKIASGKESGSKKCSHHYGSLKLRSDRSYLQVSGRTFLIGE